MGSSPTWQPLTRWRGDWEGGGVQSWRGYWLLVRLAACHHPCPHVHTCEGTKGQMDGHFPEPPLLICIMGNRTTARVPAKTQRALSKAAAAGQGQAGAGQGLAGSLPCHLRPPGRPPRGGGSLGQPNSPDRPWAGPGAGFPCVMPTVAGSSRRSSLVPALNPVILVCTQLSACVCCQARLLLCRILDHSEGEKALPSAAVCLTLLLSLLCI